MMTDSHTAHSRLLDQARARLASKRPPDSRFAFAVLGDSRWWEPVVQPATFRELVRTANLLRAAFIVHLGDMIHGYKFDLERLNREWDEFAAVAGGSESPLIPLVGNHEVTAPTHERLYRERIGDLYFSFDFGHAHFVCLDSEEVGSAGRIGAEQLAWLRADLGRTGRRRRFVFIHRPLWLAADIWEPVHRLLVSHRVTAVFAGHRHELAVEPPRDGVRYFTSGGAGSGFVRAPEEGCFHHLLWVTVEGAQVHYAVVRPGGVLPIDILEQPDQVRAVGVECEFDPQEIDLLARGVAAMLSHRDPVQGAASLAREACGNLRSVALALIERLADGDAAGAVAALIDAADPNVADAALAGIMGGAHPAARAIAAQLLNAAAPDTVRRAAFVLARDARAEFPQRLRAAVGDIGRAAAIAADAVGDVAGAVKVHILVRICDAAAAAFPEAEAADAMLRLRCHQASGLAAGERFEEAMALAREIQRQAPGDAHLVGRAGQIEAYCLAALGRAEAIDTRP